MSQIQASQLRVGDRIVLKGRECIVASVSGSRTGKPQSGLEKTNVVGKTATGETVLDTVPSFRMFDTFPAPPASGDGFESAPAPAEAPAEVLAEAPAEAPADGLPENEHEVQDAQPEGAE